MLRELQNTILEMIARGEPLGETIDRLCREVEIIAPGIVCSVLKIDDGRLRPLSAPSLPQSYSVALDGTAIGPCVGSCGTAAYLGECVTVTDIEQDPRWHGYRSLALDLGLLACWSTPIFSAGRVTGTFAFYYRNKRGPTALEHDIVDACVHLCAIALERHERVVERERLTYTDSMTGLPNRARFNDVHGRLQKGNAHWSVLLADIDNLKMVNDTFGHAAGDDLIKTVARRIAAVAGAQSTFRLGGDEFAVLVLPTSSNHLDGIAAQILSAIKRPSDCGGHIVFPGLTIGGATAHPDDSPDIVRQNADFALYHAKEQSRGQYVEYSANLGTAITDRFRAIRDVGIALAEDRIDAYYQPIVRLDSAAIVGFEALCRMTTRSGDIIPAASFHEATKDAQVAAHLTQRMLSRVAADARRWIDAGIPFQHVGVNLSAADFHGGNLADRICTIFQTAGVPLKHIILEVTESVYIGQRDHVVADEIKALRSKGLRVALDDFGTGFASLTHLLTVPVDIIKIDKSFVDRMVPGDAAIAIIEGVLGIARKLGIRVVAEGIETAEQAGLLQEMGARLGQGYLFSRAVNRDIATTLLQKFGEGGAVSAIQAESLEQRSVPARHAS